MSNSSIDNARANQYTVTQQPAILETLEYKHELNAKEETSKQKRSQSHSSTNWHIRKLCYNFVAACCCCCLCLWNSNDSDSNGCNCCLSDDNDDSCCDGSGCECGDCNCDGCEC